MKRVVVIDDSEIILGVACDALEEAGYEVTGLTEPSREGITGKGMPDLLVIDVNMPEAFGDDVARFLMDGWGFEGPVLLYSSLEEEELAERAEEAGVSGYVSKSWGVERLVEEVDNRLRPSAGSSRPRPGYVRDSYPSLHDIEVLGDGSGVAGVSEEERGILRRFARRCEDRAARAEELLGPAAAEPQGGMSARYAIYLTLHDWVGEAEILGLHEVSAVARSLLRVLKHAGALYRRGERAGRFRDWLRRLSSVCATAAGAPADGELRRALRELQAEIAAELSSLGADPGGAGEESSDDDWVESSRRILVLDDSPILREALALELKKRGHEVWAAGDLDEFNELLVEVRPEVIFLDVNMPEIQGDALCRRLRRKAETGNSLILLLSSIPDEELAELAKKACADGYLSKHHDLEEVMELFESILSDIIF